MVVVRLPLDNVWNKSFALLGCPSRYSAVLSANHNENHSTNQLSLHARDLRIDAKIPGDRQCRLSGSTAPALIPVKTGY